MLSLLSACPLSAQQQQAGPRADEKYSPIINAMTQDGRYVCISSPNAQIPGHPNLFLGRGHSFGTLEECHEKPAAGSHEFLAVFRMDWQKNKMVMQNYLLRPPVKTNGFLINSSIDPFVVSHNGELWVSFEASTPRADSTCVAPMTPDLKGLDLSRMTVVAMGELGAKPKTGQIVGVRSASTPVLLSFNGHLFVYWTIDPAFNNLPEMQLISRGIELVQDPQGRMWPKGSPGKPVMCDDERLTSLVRYPDKSDNTANHVAHLRSLYPFGDKILAFFTVGGTAGNECCHSSHELSPGCWRMSLSVVDQPIGENVFGKNVFDLPELPINETEYPRLFKGPSGGHFLFGSFGLPKNDFVRPDQPQFEAGSFNLRSGESKVTSAGTLKLLNQGNLHYINLNGKESILTPKSTIPTDDKFLASFQKDGNLVIHHDSDTVWQSGTSGHPNSALVFSENEPSLSIIDKSSNTYLWPWKVPVVPVPVHPQIPKGFRYIPFDGLLKQALETHGRAITGHEKVTDTGEIQFPAGSFELKAGESKHTDVGTFKMQKDGNLVFADDSGHAVWNSDQHAAGEDERFLASFQGDGNFVIYRDKQTIWSSGTNGHPDSSLVVSKFAPYVYIVDRNNEKIIWPELWKPVAGP